MRGVSQDDEQFFLALQRRILADVKRLWENDWCKLATESGRPAGYARLAMLNALVNQIAVEGQHHEWEWSRDLFLEICSRAWEAQKKCGRLQ